MICVDTSVWIAALRGGQGSPARHLAALLEGDEVALPVPVRLEVLAGAAKRDLPALADGFRGVASLIPGRTTWETVEAWVARAVSAGQRFGVMDLLIGAIAREHGARLWSFDADFARMAELGLIELYAAP